MGKIVVLLIALVAVISCDEVNRHEEPDTGEIIQSCTIPAYPGADQPLGMVSCWFGSERLILFSGFSIETDSNHIPDNYAAWSSSGDLCSELDYIVSEHGDLRRFIPLTPDEIAFNDTSTTGYIAIWPIGAVHIPQDGTFAYYNKVIVRGFLDIEYLGTGLARLGGESAERLTNKFVDSTMFWHYPRAGWGEGATFGNDGYVYLFRNSQVDLLGWETRMARVLPENLWSPALYEYYAGFDVWDSNEDRAGVVLRDCSAISVSWNEYLRRYIQVYSSGDAISIRAATEPWMEWSDPLPLFHDADAVGFFDISGVAVHPEINGFSNRALKISYLDHSWIEAVEFELEEK